MRGAGGNPAKPTRTTRPDYSTLTSDCPRRTPSAPVREAFFCDEGKAQAKIAVVLEVASDRPAPVSGDHRLQHVAPLVGAVHVAGTKGRITNVNP